MSRRHYGNLSSKQRRRIAKHVARYGYNRSKSDAALNAVHTRRDGTIQIVELGRTGGRKR